jgi:hypothetical protein
VRLTVELERTEKCIFWPTGLNLDCFVGGCRDNMGNVVPVVAVCRCSVTIARHHAPAFHTVSTLHFSISLLIIF